MWSQSLHIFQTAAYNVSLGGKCYFVYYQQIILSFNLILLKDHHTVSMFWTFSFVFSNDFILDRAVLDSEPILATLGMRKEQTLGGTAAYHKAPCTWAFYDIDLQPNWGKSSTHLQSSWCSGRPKGSMVTGRGGRVLYGDKHPVGAHSRDVMLFVHYGLVLQGLLHPEEEPPPHQADV